MRRVWATFTMALAFITAACNESSGGGGQTAPGLFRAEFELSGSQWETWTSETGKTVPVKEILIENTTAFQAPVTLEVTREKLPADTEITLHWTSYGSKPREKVVFAGDVLDFLYSGGIGKTVASTVTGVRESGVAAWQILLVGPENAKPDLGKVTVVLTGPDPRVTPTTTPSPTPSFPPESIKASCDGSVATNGTYSCGTRVTPQDWTNWNIYFDEYRSIKDIFIENLGALKVPASLTVTFEKPVPYGNFSLAGEFYAEKPTQENSVPVLDVPFSIGMSQTVTVNIYDPPAEAAKYLRLRLEAPKNTAFDLGVVSLELTPSE